MTGQNGKITLLNVIAILMVKKMPTSFTLSKPAGKYILSYTSIKWEHENIVSLFIF